MASISPTARKAAEELGVDLDSVEGTGKKGSITVADVKAAAGPDAGEAEKKPGKGELKSSVIKNRVEYPAGTKASELDLTSDEKKRLENLDVL